MSMIKIFFPPKLKYGSSRYFYITLVFNFCIDERKLMCRGRGSNPRSNLRFLIFDFRLKIKS